MNPAKDNEKTDIAEILDENKGLDIHTMDVSHLTTLTETMIICTANSKQHAQALATKIQRYCKNKGIKKVQPEGYSHGEWIIVDTTRTFVHIFQQEWRDKYSLEKLWSISEDALNKQPPHD